MRNKTNLLFFVLIFITFKAISLESKPDHWKEDPNFLLPYKNIQEAVCPYPERNITIESLELFNISFLAIKKSLNVLTEIMNIVCLIVIAIER